MTLPAPVVNRLVALENSIPQAVVNTVSKSYPFSVPVVLGRKLAGSERTIFTLDGNELLNYDEEMLQRLFRTAQQYPEYPAEVCCALS